VESTQVSQQEFRAMNRDVEEFYALPRDQFGWVERLEITHPSVGAGMTLSLVLAQELGRSPRLHLVFSGVFGLRIDPGWQLHDAFFLLADSSSDDSLAPLGFTEEEDRLSFRCASFAHAIERE
jgi:hypothetical protein